MAETAKQKEKRVKDWLKAHGHNSGKVDAKKADTPETMLRMLAELHDVDVMKVKRIIAGGHG